MCETKCGDQIVSMEKIYGDDEVPLPVLTRGPIGCRGEI